MRRTAVSLLSNGAPRRGITQNDISSERVLKNIARRRGPSRQPAKYIQMNHAALEPMMESTWAGAALQRSKKSWVALMSA